MQLIFCGLGTIFIGLAVLIKPVFYSQKYSITIDLSNVKWFLGPIFLCYGIYCLYISAKREGPEFTVEYWICPNCEELRKFVGNKTRYCKKCKKPLEKLNGFYKKQSVDTNK
jgi:hypothetical protein